MNIFWFSLGISKASDQPSLAATKPSSPNLTENSELLNKFLKYCDDHSILPFESSIMKIKIFIHFAFTNLKCNADDIQRFLSDLEKHHIDSTLSAHPLLVQAQEIFIRKQEQMQNVPSVRPAINPKQSDQKPKQECCVCSVTEKTGKNYGSQSITCDPCRRFYRACVLSSAPPKQHESCQGHCNIIGVSNRKNCGSCRFEKLEGLGMVIRDLASKLRYVFHIFS